MGNCLKGTSNEDISLLRENEGQVDNTNELLQAPPYGVSRFTMMEKFVI